MPVWHQTPLFEVTNLATLCIKGLNRIRQAPMVPRPAQVCTLNSISVGSAVFAGFAVLTHSHATCDICDNSPRLALIASPAVLAMRTKS